jgi:hypothetical protein
MNVNLWGPSFWITLHGLAVLADRTDDPAFDPKTLFAPLRQILPCSVCRNHFAEIYEDIREPLVGTLEHWIYDVHNKVNDKQYMIQIQKVQDLLKLTDEERDDLYSARDLLCRSISFQMHQARSALHYNDLIPTRDFGLVLVCLYSVHDTETIETYVKPWLYVVKQFGFRDIISELLQLSHERAYERSLRFKYGENDPNFDLTMAKQTAKLLVA